MLLIILTGIYFQSCPVCFMLLKSKPMHNCSLLYIWRILLFVLHYCTGSYCADNKHYILQFIKSRSFLSHLNVQNNASLISLVNKRTKEDECAVLYVGMLTFRARPTFSPAHATHAPVARIWRNCDPGERPQTRYLSLSGRLTLNTKTCPYLKCSVQYLFRLVIHIYRISCWQWAVTFVFSHVAVLLAWPVCLRRIEC